MTDLLVGLLVGAVLARAPWVSIAAWARAAAECEWAATMRDRGDMWAGRPQDLYLPSDATMAPWPTRGGA